jgi:hypothetical protein
VFYRIKRERKATGGSVIAIEDKTKIPTHRAEINAATKVSRPPKKLRTPPEIFTRTFISMAFHPLEWVGLVGRDRQPSPLKKHEFIIPLISKYRKTFFKNNISHEEDS